MNSVDSITYYIGFLPCVYIYKAFQFLSLVKSQKSVEIKGHPILQIR